MTKLVDVTGIPPNTMEYKEDASLACQSLLGIELEIEDAHESSINTALSKTTLWTATGDGSLRNGIELVSVPISGANIAIAMQELDTVLKNSGPKTRITQRCSLHVHIDMRDTTVHQLFNLLVVYTIFEQELFKYVGIKRRGNPYCTPLVDSMNLQEMLGNVRHRATSLGKVIRNWPKYSSINIQPLNRYGTVEVRMHPGTLDVNEIYDWVGILLCLKAYVLNNPKKNTQSIIDSVCSDADGLVLGVFGKRFITEITNDVFSSMVEGARIAQQVYRFKPAGGASRGMTRDFVIPRPTLRERTTREQPRQFTWTEEPTMTNWAPQGAIQGTITADSRIQRERDRLLRALNDVVPVQPTPERNR